ncbi:hypothetical protein GCM10011511_47270 [Puia dinghuensis]|uniref:Secretion system C-terminal sorting domain-containing protein n=2 Tax=Puia dinghuensis TaxID=1792502 RepID=A0A8J2UHD8_9BACT|nr:hypothetical protein GCM10011511_47270 [Puia dinghuensis]
MTVTLTANAQFQPSLEFASGAGPAGPGPSVANQVITFKDNTNNPTGNTFVAYTTPTVTCTYSLSNQQYTLPSTELSTQTGVCFGAAINNGGINALASSLYPQMSFISAAPNNDFTSLPTVPVGTGISTTNNYATQVFTSAMPLYHANLSTTGRFYMANLTITFSSPLANPVLHIVGIGAFYNTQGFTTELECQTPGVTLSELSGSPELNVTANKILNSSATPSSVTGSGAASGSILVAGTVTQLVFKLYVRGDGGGPWASGSNHSGDQWLIGVSEAVTNVVLPVSLEDFTATAQAGKTGLQWTTATENNTSYFDVQYSTDQLSWQTIGRVTAAGYSSLPRNYGFIHSNPTAGENYYRLNMVDQDNHSVYSPVRVVSFASTAQLSYYPNPTRNSCTITTDGTPLAGVTLFTLDGRLLQQVNNFASGGSLDLSPYPNGIYLIAVKDTNGHTQILKILKN